MVSLGGVTLPVGEEITILSNGRVIAKILPNGQKQFFQEHMRPDYKDIIRLGLVRIEFQNGDIHIYSPDYNDRGIMIDVIRRIHFANGDIEYYGYDSSEERSSYLRRKSIKNGEEIEYYGKDVDDNTCLQKIIDNGEDTIRYYEGKAGIERIVKSVDYNENIVHIVDYCEGTPGTERVVKREIYEKGSIVPHGKVKRVILVKQENSSKKQKT
jgi:hypothetical protein